VAAKIAILPENLCNQIAAGEVVERPASVVRELVENALDAGARSVIVEVEGGGRKLVRVSDDGEGMGRDDVMLALERHATSKIHRDEDLFRIATLGFRGEAIPSIAAVSRFLMRSRNDESAEGWEVAVEGGMVRRAGAIGAPIGTTVEVRDLFFNLPARRKFLRSDETELGHIGDIVTRLALGHPEVQFRFFHNGRPLLDVPRHAQLAERIAALLGRPLLKQLHPVDLGGAEPLGIRGFAAAPEAARATSAALYTYINGRFIRDRLVQHAVLEAYRHLLPRGRYPAAVLFLTVAPEEVDVNVHPTKQEVRFREQRVVHDLITTAIRQALAPAPWLLDESRPQPAPVATDREPVATPIAAQLFAATQPTVREGHPAYLPLAAAASAPLQQGGILAVPEPPAHIDTATGYFSGLRLIGQFHNSYLVLEEGDALLLVDQHAAHERIGFERLRAQLREGDIPRQALLFPKLFRLDFAAAAQLQEHLDDLARFGFEVEPFGGLDFALKALPQGVDETAGEQLVRDVAAEIVAHGASTLAAEALDKILILLACHGMVRANQRLAASEMQALLQELDQVDFKTHCPHGRPVLQRLSLGEIERLFKRG
jgi:DNA mismatch repair protein MutL